MNENANEKGNADEPIVESAEGENKAPIWTDEMQREFDKRAAALRKSAYSEGEKNAQKKFESRQQEQNEIAEKKRLESVGEFEAAYKKSEQARIETEERAARAEARIADLNRLNLYNGYITDNAIEFENAQARMDGFNALDVSIETEDDIKSAFADMKKNRPYLFRKNLTTPNTDARQRGANPIADNDKPERMNNLRARFNIRAPR